MNGQYDPGLRYVEEEYLERRSMPIGLAIAQMLFNIVKDPLTDFGKEMLQKHLSEASDDVKKALDDAVNEDKSHTKKTLEELIDG